MLSAVCLDWDFLKLLQGSDRGIKNRIGITEIQCGADFVFWMPESH